MSGGFSAKTQHDYLRIVERFAIFLGRSPDLATPEDIRRFQVEQREAGVPAQAMNSHISGLRSSSRRRLTVRICRASCSAFPIPASSRWC
jgi:hypothetical protein